MSDMSERHNYRHLENTGCREFYKKILPVPPDFQERGGELDCRWKRIDGQTAGQWPKPGVGRFINES